MAVCYALCALLIAKLNTKIPDAKNMLVYFLPRQTIFCTTSILSRTEKEEIIK